MRSDEEWDLASKVVGACAGLLAVRIPRLWGKTIPSPLATVQPELIASQ